LNSSKVSLTAISHVLLISLLAVLVTLVFERTVGIEWDFHPDSVTYATLSDEVSDNIFNQGFPSAINNSYYLLCSALDQSISLIIAMNMLIFILTNLLILKLHVKFTGDIQLQKYSLLLLLLLNPYRMHLATTMLKDTLIIFLALLALSSFKNLLMTIIFMPFIRLMGILYYAVLLPRKFFLFGIFCAIPLGLIYSESLIGLILDFNSNLMQFRDFDSVPSFQDFGLLGVALRSIVWPLLALTGVFPIFGLSAPFLAIAVGIIMFNIYTFALVGHSIFTWRIFLSMALFAILVTGYGSFIRYIYPFLVMAPFIVILGYPHHQKNRV